jgi:hypothetical protein
LLSSALLAISSIVVGAKPLAKKSSLALAMMASCLAAFSLSRLSSVPILITDGHIMTNSHKYTTSSAVVNPFLNNRAPLIRWPLLLQ